MANNNARINTNDIFKAGAYRIVNGERKRMTEIVKDNIINDYKVGGVKTVDLNVFVTNVKNINGVTKKFVDKGDLLQINDVCRIDDLDGKSIYKDANGDPIYFKILSRTFRYEGQPTIELQLQEVKGDYAWQINGLKLTQI